MDGRRQARERHQKGRGYLGFGTVLRGSCLAGMDLMMSCQRSLGRSAATIPSKAAFEGRPRLLVSPAEFHVIAPGVEPVAPRGGRGKHLQRHGALHFRVVLRGGLQEVIRAEVHHHKFSAVEETDAVGAGLQGLTHDFESNLVEQIGWYFSLIPVE